MKGSHWTAANSTLTPGAARRNAVNAALASSAYFGGWCTVPYALGSLLVSCDVVSIGDETDYYRVPLDAKQAQAIASKFGAILPTSKISDLIWQQAKKHGKTVSPQGLVQTAADALVMMNEATAIKHNKLIGPAPEATLLAGHKKDVILDNKLLEKPKSVAIYGFHKPDGQPIQTASTKHGFDYYDYSHGVRLVSRTDTSGRDLLEVLSGPNAAALTYDPPLQVLSYDNIPGSGTNPNIPVPGIPSGGGNPGGGVLPQNHANARALISKALPGANLSTLQLAQAVGLFESSYSAGFPGTNNWGAVLCNHLAPCGPGCKEHSSGVCLKVYPDPFSGVADYIRIMLKRPLVVAAMSAGDLDAFTAGMGTPPVYSELAMNNPGLYSQKIGQAVASIAKALGEPNTLLSGGGGTAPPPFLPSPQGQGQVC